MDSSPPSSPPSSLPTLPPDRGAKRHVVPAPVFDPGSHLSRIAPDSSLGREGFSHSPPSSPYEQPTNSSNFQTSSVHSPRRGLTPPAPARSGIAATPQPEASDEPPLCEEQAALVDLIVSGKNVFYTGAAGTGKSRVLRAFVEGLRGEGKAVVVTAPTGKAALAVGGCTTWTYAGWTPDSHRLGMDELKKRASRKHAWKRLDGTDVLVIDEISMVENHHLERLNQIMKAARSKRRTPYDHSINAELPFGGCQVVVTGDFCQLPPVKPFEYCITCGLQLLRTKRDTGNKDDSPGVQYTCPDGHGTWLDSDKWAFKSDAWGEASFHYVELQKVHRQAGDVRFRDILNKLRMGIPLSQKEVMMLTDRNRPRKTLNAVRLFPTRVEVKKYNAEMFAKLQTEPHLFEAHDTFHWNEKLHPSLKMRGKKNFDNTLVALNDHRFERAIQLKKGMPVVLLSNIDLKAGLVNGSQGIVCGFEPVNKDSIPQKTITSDAEPDVAYTRKIMNQEVHAFASRPGVNFFPVVLFVHCHQKRIIYPECSTHDAASEKAPRQDLDGNTKLSLLCRTQIPLIAAWSISIHKSQGMTLRSVIVDQSRAFEEGMVYVALSRATSIDGLTLEGDTKGLLVGVGANPEVQEFYMKSFYNNQPRPEWQKMQEVGVVKEEGQNEKKYDEGLVQSLRSTHLG